MKKSVAYNVAQIAVLKSQNISAEDKLEILRVLMDDENIAIYVEEREAKADEAE